MSELRMFENGNLITRRPETLEEAKEMIAGLDYSAVLERLDELGLAVVPKIPTEAMIEAGRKSLEEYTYDEWPGNAYDAETAYRAMLTIGSKETEDVAKD